MSGDKNKRDARYRNPIPGSEDYNCITWKKTRPEPQVVSDTIASVGNDRGKVEVYLSSKENSY